MYLHQLSGRGHRTQEPYGSAFKLCRFINHKTHARNANLNEPKVLRMTKFGTN